MTGPRAWRSAYPELAAAHRARQSHLFPAQSHLVPPQLHFSPAHSHSGAGSVAFRFRRATGHRRETVGRGRGGSKTDGEARGEGRLAGAGGARADTAAGGGHRLWTIDPDADSELVRRVYARSWPATCRGDFSDDEVITRLGDRDQWWWQRRLARSDIAIAGGPSQGGYGFVLAGREGDEWALEFLFCEPAAFGSGLAGALHDAALVALGRNTDAAAAWILPQGGLHLAAGTRCLSARDNGFQPSTAAEWRPRLPHNLRSQRFFGRRGWVPGDLAVPPWSPTMPYLRFRRHLGGPGEEG